MKPTFRDHFRSLWRRRELLVLWTVREIRVRYKQSLLGALWALLQPVALMAIFTVVFSVFARVPTGGTPYPLFSFSGLVPWMLFSASLTFGSATLVSNLTLVTKMSFPREILPMASTGAALLDFFIGMAALLVLAAAWGVYPSPYLLWLPLVLLLEIGLILGLVLPLSALCVFFRDVRFTVPLALQVWLFASPVVYPVTLVPERFQIAYFLNPMAGIIDSFRRILVEGQSPQLLPLLLSALVTGVVLLVGISYFKRSERLFADVI